MNTFMSNLEKDTNFKLTENGAVAHKTTLSAVYDMFALAEHIEVVLMKTVLCFL